MWAIRMLYLFHYKKLFYQPTILFVNWFISFYQPRCLGPFQMQTALWYISADKLYLYLLSVFLSTRISSNCSPTGKIRNVTFDQFQEAANSSWWLTESYLFIYRLENLQFLPQLRPWSNCRCHQSVFSVNIYVLLTPYSRDDQYELLQS